MKTKLICIFMALLMFLISCTSKEHQIPVSENATDTVAETETKSPFLKDNLPADLDFDGVTYNMLSPDEYGGQCLVEKEVGEVLNDAQYKMEMIVESRLNVVINETLTGFWDMTRTVDQLVSSGDTTYNCITMMDRFAFSLAQNNYFLPMQDLEYIDLSQAYWGGNLTKSMSIADNYYFAVSSFNLKSFKNTACILINTKLADKYKINLPYDKVDAGTWTFNDMFYMSKYVTNDLNGDSVMDRNDAYGIGSYDRRGIPATMWISGGESIVKKDADDIPYIAAYGNEKFLSIMEKTQDIFFVGENCLQVANDSGTNFNTIDIFKEGRQLMLASTFKSITELRDMGDDFSILPMPKYDETQGNYYSRTFDTMFTMVPTTVTDTDMVGAVLEALSCAGYNNVIPAYIESTLKDKCSRNTESVKSIQIAFDSRTIDLAETFIFDYFGDVAMYNLLKAPQLNIASSFEANRTSVDNTLQSLIHLSELQ